MRDVAHSAVASIAEQGNEIAWLPVLARAIDVVNHIEGLRSGRRRPRGNRSSSWSTRRARCGLITADALRFVAAEREVEETDITDDITRYWDVVDPRAPKPPPAPKAPKPGRNSAYRYARDAHNHNFSIRRGLSAERGRRIVLYDNSPNQHRVSDHERLRAWLRAEGIPIIAEASYPASGIDAGYTTAWVVEAEHEREDDIHDAWQAIINSH